MSISTQARFDRMVDGPDMWHTGPKRTPGPSAPSIPDADAARKWWISADTHNVREVEILNMLLHPERYDRAESEIMLRATAYAVRQTEDHGYADEIAFLIEESREQHALKLDLYDLDCHTCRLATYAREDLTCKHCGGELS